MPPKRPWKKEKAVKKPPATGKVAGIDDAHMMTATCIKHRCVMWQSVFPYGDARCYKCEKEERITRRSSGTATKQDVAPYVILTDRFESCTHPDDIHACLHEPEIKAALDAAKANPSTLLVCRQAWKYHKDRLEKDEYGW